MANKLIPHKYVSSIYCITPQFLQGEGIDALLLDVDNTMISNTAAYGDEKLTLWINGLKAGGIRLCIVSNGSGRRVKRFNKAYGLPAVFFAVKPRRRGFEKALRLLGSDRMKTAVVGDQIFTDIYGGNRCGLKTILVSPIDRLESGYIKIKRLFEKRVLKNMHPEE